MNSDDKFVAGGVVGLEDLDGPVVNVKHGNGLDKVVGISLVYIECHRGGIAHLPTAVWDCSREVCLDGEVEIAILVGNCHFILRLPSGIVFFVIPAIKVALPVSVVGNLEIVEAGEEVRRAYEEYAIGLGGQRVHGVWDLSLVVGTPIR